MDDTTYIIVVLILSLGFLFGIAYWLQRRSKSKKNQEDACLIGRPSKIWSWYLRIMVSVLILLVIATFTFQNLVFIWVALVLVVLGCILGYAYRIYRLTKMSKPQK